MLVRGSGAGENVAATLQMCLKSVQRDRQIASLDPLEVDGILPQLLPSLNREAKLKELKALGRAMVASFFTRQSMSSDEALAALRDLGFLAASLARHGAALKDVNGLELALMEAGEKGREIPRDTVFSYATRNPTGMRRRTFIGTREEEIFIQEVTGALEAIPEVIALLTRIRDFESPSLEMIRAVGSAGPAFSRVAKSLLTVKRSISPEKFSIDLRPYFPPLQVGGATYFGPGGAQMPLMVIDSLLMGWDNVRYQQYFEENMVYMPRCFRCLSESLFPVEALVPRLDRWAGSRGKDRSLLQVIDATMSLLRIILRMRLPHRRMAENNMSVRPPSSVGSGGYTTEILDVLIDMTQRALMTLHNARQSLSSWA